MAVTAFAACVAFAAGTHASAPAFYAPPYGDPVGQHAPYAGPINHAHAAPTFRWGWFGAQHFPAQATRHRGYYGELYRWRRHRVY